MDESNSVPDRLIEPDASLARLVETNRRTVFAIALLAALAWITLYLQFTDDDAYISFRYGKNLVESHVWNWNPSGPREQAYTSFLYTAFGIVPALLHISAPLFFKFLGLACVAAMIYRLATLARSRFACLLGVLLIAFHPWLWIHAFSGLETPLYMLLLLEMGLAVDRADAVPPVYIYSLFLLLPLTRPEGIVFGCVGVILFWSRQAGAPRRMPWFVASFLLATLYLLGQSRYFHHLLPNPFYAKIGTTSSWMSLRNNLFANLSQSKDFFLVLFLLWLLARKRHIGIFALTGFLLLLLLFAPHALDVNYADRFYFQIMFPLLLLFLVTENIVPIARIAYIIAIVSVFGASYGQLRGALTYFHDLSRVELDMGRRLAPFAPHHSLLTEFAGELPYASGWIAYDSVGLGTYRIVRYGLSLTLIRELHPDLILVEASEPGAPVLETDARDSRSPIAVELTYIHQSGEYEYVGSCVSGYGYIAEFLRKDATQRDGILAALRQNARNSVQDRFSFKNLLLQKYVPWLE